MSVSSLTTIAAARAEANTSARKPTKAEVGKVPQDHSDADTDAGITDVLAKQIPTELIAPYTALTAAIVGHVAKPTKKVPHPDQLATWRWAAFIVLVVSVIAMVWTGKATKSKSWAFPILAVTAGVLAAVAWAFLMPGSPLIPYLHGKNAPELLPLFVAIGGIVVSSFTAALLTSGPFKIWGEKKAQTTPST